MGAARPAYVCAVVQRTGLLRLGTNTLALLSSPSPFPAEQPRPPSRSHSLEKVALNIVWAFRRGLHTSASSALPLDKALAAFSQVVLTFLRFLTSEDAQSKLQTLTLTGIRCASVILQS